MKDATGELSMTAIAVVAIAAIGLLFTTLIWPTIKVNIMRSTYCSSAFNCQCPTGGGMCNCQYCDTSAANATAGNTATAVNCANPATIQCSPNSN